MKIALDIHGVCSSMPSFFSELSRLFFNAGHEVHILTGRSVKDGAVDEIKELGISYTHFFSSVDYHREKGTMMKQSPDDENWGKRNVWMDDDIWDRTKGDYCKENEIDFYIDDTERYGKYFETPFAYIKIKKEETKNNKWK